MLFTWLITHQTAPLEIRERFTLTSARSTQVQRQLLEHPQVQSCLVISTCNRTEVCLHIADNTAADLSEMQLDQWMSAVLQMQADTFAPIRQILRDENALLHLMRVASGLDSQILGDAQVLGQVRKAWRDSCHTAPPDAQMRLIMQAVLQAAKRVRSETDLGLGTVSVSSVAARQCQQIFGRTETLRVMLIGAGKTAHLTAKHLQQQGVKQFVVVGRNSEKIRNMAAALQGDSILLEDCAEHLWQADIVVGASTAPEPLLGLQQVRDSLRRRRYKPQLLLDLAVPRNIAGEVAQIPEAYLMNLEQLNEEVDENLAQRHRAVPAAMDILQQQIGLFRRHSGRADTAGLIQNFRQIGEKDVSETAAQLANQLRTGELTEDELNRQLRALSRRLMHLPTLLLRDKGTANTHTGCEPTDE